MPSSVLTEPSKNRSPEKQKRQKKENFFILSPEQLSDVRFKALQFTAITAASLTVIFIIIFGLTYSSLKQRAFRSGSATFQEQAKALQNQMEQYRTQIEQYQSQIDQYRFQTEQYQKELAHTREQIKAYTLARETVKTELDESYAKISDLWKSIRMMEDLLGKTLTAQIMRVNRSLHYVIINLGLRDQIKMGDKLTVERDGKVIGSLEIQKLYDHFAAAAILQESKQTPMREGDAIQGGPPQKHALNP